MPQELKDLVDKANKLGLNATTNPFGSQQQTSSGDTAQNSTASGSGFSSSFFGQTPLMRDDMMCKRCLKQPENTIFLPCYHVYGCKDCAQLCKECPICGSQVNRRERCYTAKNHEFPFFM